MTIVQIDETRLAKIQSLYRGSHPKNGNGHVEACAMEAVAFIAGEPWSDHPECVCPVIGAFMRAWNDGLADAERTALILPLVPRLVGTRSTKKIEQRRATMAADWLIRVHTPAWLRLAKLTEQADLLASLPEITDFKNCPSLMPALTAVKKDAAAARDAAWAAAWDAAWAAAWAAAGAAARDAAWAAAWDAAGAAARDAAWAAAWAAAGAAARDAAWDAARDAAGAAARDAAWAAAKKALAATQLELQKSALELVERMIAAD